MFLKALKILDKSIIKVSKNYFQFARGKIRKLHEKLLNLPDVSNVLLELLQNLTPVFSSNIPIKF